MMRFAFQVMDYNQIRTRVDQIANGTIFEGEIDGENCEGLYLRVGGGVVHLVSFTTSILPPAHLVYNFRPRGSFQATGL